MKTYFIPEFRQELFEKKMTRTANKAEKLGIPFGFLLVGEKMESYKTSRKEVIFYKSFEYEVHGESPTINGFSFLGKIESLGDKNLIHSHNTEFDFSEFYTSKLVCEHCNANRQRNFYYIIQNDETSQVKMVGGNCLANYIEIANAEQIASFYETFFIEDETEESEFESFGRSSQANFKTLDILTLAYKVINENGYLSATSARDNGGLATKWQVLNAWADGERDNTQETLNAVRNVMETVQSKLESMSELSNYENTMMQVLSLEYVKSNHVGYLVSVFAMYNRMLETETRKEDKKESGHVGIVGGKIENIQVKTVYTNELDSHYGITHLYKFVDDAGNLYTWFSSRDKYLYSGDETTIIKATVKKHDSYNGENQTIITRAKLSG